MTNAREPELPRVDPEQAGELAGTLHGLRIRGGEHRTLRELLANRLRVRKHAAEALYARFDRGWHAGVSASLGRSVNPPRMYVESHHAMALLIETGLGPGIVPRGLVPPFSRTFGIRAVALDDPRASRDLMIYFSSSTRLQSASRLLVGYLRQKA